MELTKLIVTTFLLVFLPYLVNAAPPKIFDITNPKYGAKPGADISKALTAAWKEASQSPTPTKIVVPKGKWILSQAKLEGNKAPLELAIMGTIEANPNPDQLPNKEWEWITINYVNYFTLSGGGVLDGKGQEAWRRNDCAKNPKCAKRPINLSFNFLNNSIIHDITSKDSKNWHCNCIASNNVTFDRVKISAPGNSINTDGIHVGWSHNIRIINSVIGTGDDCVSMGDDQTNIHIENVQCGPGHGISIGSLGGGANEKDVKGIYVRKCKFINTDNGVRVKTWPSTPGAEKVSELYFEDLTMQNVSNPIVIDQQYCPSNQCKKDKASLIQISKVRIKNVKGTSWTKEALTLKCSAAKPCQDVQISNVDLKYVNPVPGKAMTICENVKPVVTGVQNPPICRP